MKCLIIFSWLTLHGYPEPLSLAIVANLWAESHCNPTASNPYQFGLAQWQGKRLKELKKIKDYINPYIQLQYLDQEIKSLRLYSKLYQSKSALQATITFCLFYELPRDKNKNCLKRSKLILSKPWEKDQNEKIH